MNLAQVELMQNVRITHMHLTKQEQNRLFYLGFYVGATLQKIRVAPMHDPQLFYIRGNQITLRKECAKKIEVEVLL